MELEPCVKVWNDAVRITSQNTADAYLQGVTSLCKVLGTRPDCVLSKIKSGELDVYNILNQWVASQKLAPITIKSRLSGIKNFLLFNDVTIDENKFRVKVRKPKFFTISEDKIPTKEELNTIFNLATPRARVAILLGIHGLRVGEIASLKVGDIHLDDKVPHIKIRNTNAKEKKGRIVPITEQLSSVIADHIRNKKPDKLVFGGNDRSIQRMINNSFDKAGLKEKDLDTQRRLIHAHCLRKYCKTMLAVSGCQESFVASIMGHKKYLDDNYLRVSPEQIINEFRKAVPALTVGLDQATSVKIEDNQDRIRILETEVKMLRDTLVKLVDIKDEYVREAYEKTFRDGMVEQES